MHLRLPPNARMTRCGVNVDLVCTSTLREMTDCLACLRATIALQQTDDLEIPIREDRPPPRAFRGAG